VVCRSDPAGTASRRHLLEPGALPGAGVGDARGVGVRTGQRGRGWAEATPWGRGTSPAPRLFAFMRSNANMDGASVPGRASISPLGSRLGTAGPTRPAAVTPPVHRSIEPRINPLPFLKEAAHEG